MLFYVKYVIIFKGDKMSETFVFDLDGTIIDPKTNQIPISTINALRRLKDNGHRCLIATGRSLESVLITDVLELIAWDGFVLSNGQHVLQSLDKELYKHYFDYEAIIAISKYVDQHQLPMVFISDTNFLNREPNDAMIASHNFFHEPIPNLIKPFENKNIRMLMVYTDNHEHFDNINKIPNVKTNPGPAPYADIVDARYSKYEGIKAILESYKLDPKDYIAFGDGSNDLEMLNKAKISVAMGNANPILKLHADIITKSVHHDGIYTACMLNRWI